MVICLERGADLHMAQLMPMPLTVSCSSKSRLVLPLWYRLTWVVPDKGLLNGCVCVPGVWRDSLHVTCGLTACTPGSAPGPMLGKEYGKTLPFYQCRILGMTVCPYNWYTAGSLGWPFPTLQF